MSARAVMAASTAPVTMDLSDMGPVDMEPAAMVPADMALLDIVARGPDPQLDMEAAIIDEAV